MRVTPYSYVLNLIRQGWSQVNSWNAVIRRFSGVLSRQLSMDWAKAWTGRGAAQAMEYNPNMTFGQLLSFAPTVEIIGGRNYTVDQLSTAFSTTVQGPYDLNMLIQILKGPSQFYDQTRWQLQTGDTYLSITQRLTDTLVRSYVLGENGRLRYVSSYVIGV